MWITKNGNKYVYREYYIEPYTGKRKTVSKTLSSKSNQAQKQAQQFLSELIKEKQQAVKRSDLTLDELLTDWWEFHQKEVKHSTQVMYEKTIKRMRKTHDINLNVKISETDTQFFQKYFATLTGAYTYNIKFKHIFNQAFEHAINMQYIKENPVSRAKVPKPPKKVTDIEKVDELYLEKDEMDRLLKEMYGTFQSVRVAQASEFMFLTGMRYGELAALQVKDFNSKTKMLNIHGTLDYSDGYASAEKEMTKTVSSYRTIVLSNRAVEVFNQVVTENQLKYDWYNKDSYVFIGKTGKPLMVATINRSIKHANEKLGTDKIKKHLHTHIFRHSNISLLAELGVNEKAIMERVGHGDDKITKKIYTHVTKNVRQDVVNKLNNLGL